MNQSNINLNEVLKTSLEHQEPSVSFDEVWDKYSKNKGPVLVYKRITVLVAAALVLLVSVKYISGMPGLSNEKVSSKKLAIMFSKAESSSNSTLANKKENTSEAKLNQDVMLFSEPAPNSNTDKAKVKAKAKEKANSANAKVKANANTNAKLYADADAGSDPKAKASAKAKANININDNAKDNIAALDSKVAENADFSKLQQNQITADIARVPRVNAKQMNPGNHGSIASFVIWDNRNYYATTTLVQEKKLGKKLGKTLEQTINPQLGGDANQFPAGTEIFEIKGEDVKEVVAVKVGECYIRATVKP